MIITNKKIEVTEQMMFNQGLSFMMVAGNLGVPFSAEHKKPIKWLHATDLTEDDFDIIEDYFLNLTTPKTK